MNKIVIIAQNEAKAKEAEAHFHGLHVKKVFPGAKSFSRHFDAVVIYLHDVKEINFIKDILTKYQDAPIKAFLGKEEFGEAHTYKAKAFAEGHVATLVEHLRHEYTQLDEVIRKVFKAFDTDNSGFIDSQELAEVSKELGRQMDAAELEECLKDLDQNKDGKISFEEFQAWWLSGRQGLSGTMRRLLGYKLGALKFVDSISGTLKETLDEAANQAVDVSTNSLSININKVEHAGLSFYVKGMLLSQENKTDYHTIKGLHKFGMTMENDAYFNVIFDVVNGTAHEVAEKIHAFLKTPFAAMLKLDQHVSVITEGHKVNLCFLFKAQVATHIQAFKDLVHTIQNELKVDQSLELSLRLAASPKSLLEEGAEPLLMQLLNGISLDIKLNVWKKLADLLMRIVGNCEVDAALLPILGGVAPLFLLQIGGNLDIKIDDYMRTKIAENPLVEPVLLDAATLITSTSGKSFENDEEFFESLNELPDPFNSISQLFARHLGDEVSFEVLDEFVGLKGRVTGEGLNLILRNGLKYAN